MPQAVAANTAILNSSSSLGDVAYKEGSPCGQWCNCSWDTQSVGLDPSKPGAQQYYNSLIELYAEWGVDFIK